MAPQRSRARGRRQSATPFEREQSEPRRAPAKPAAPAAPSGGSRFSTVFSVLSVDKAATALSDAFGGKHFSRDVFEAALHPAPPLQLSAHLLAATNAMLEGTRAALRKRQRQIRLEPDVYDLDLKDAVTRKEIARQYRSEVKIDNGPGALLKGPGGVRYRLRACRRTYGHSRFSALPLDAEIVVRRRALDDFLTQHRREQRADSTDRPAATTDIVTDNSIEDAKSPSDAVDSVPAPAVASSVDVQGSSAWSADVASEIPGALNLPATTEETERRTACRTERRAAVDAYIEEVWQLKHKRLTRADIWRSARYRSRSEFERWESCSPKATKAAAERFAKILSEKPHLK